MSELVREIVEVNASIDGDEENPLLIVEAEGLAPPPAGQMSGSTRMSISRRPKTACRI